MSDTQEHPVKCGCSEFPKCTHVLYWYEGFKAGREQMLEQLAAHVEVKRYEIKDQRHQSGRPHVVIFGFALKGRNSRTEAHANRRAERLKEAIRALKEQP